MGSRLPLRQKVPAFIGLALCILGVLPPLLEHHPVDGDLFAGALGSALSVAATHAGASQHCEASTTETRGTTARRRMWVTASTRGPSSFDGIAWSTTTSSGAWPRTSAT